MKTQDPPLGKHCAGTSSPAVFLQLQFLKDCESSEGGQEVSTICLCAQSSTSRFARKYLVVPEDLKNWECHCMLC